MEVNTLMNIEGMSKIKAIELHWKNNSHHPEYHNDIYDMTELDLMEMACDCYSDYCDVYPGLCAVVFKG